MASHLEEASTLLLGIEGGGTRTIALLADSQGHELRRFEAGPANLKLMSDRQLAVHLKNIATALPRPRALGIGLAGGWEAVDWDRIRIAAAKAWPEIPCHATNDLETALAAATNPASQKRVDVLILSGTGSCCYGRNPAGRTAKVGGWGHVMGDQASGYDIGLQALQRVASHFDRTATWPKLGARLLRALQLNAPNDLIDWAQSAGKAAIAGLAREVFDAWAKHDSLASQILAEAADRLATDAAACAGRLARRGEPVRFVLAGSVLLRQPRFASAVQRRLRQFWPNAQVSPLGRESVWGAVELAKCALQNSENPLPSGRPLPLSFGAQVKKAAFSSRLSPTEQRNPLSMGLDRMSLDRSIALMLSEDARIPQRLVAAKQPIKRIICAVSQALRTGGRLFYVGSGTSGRLGVLDASECPPTFNSPPDRVQGIISGGQAALWSSVEGAEDDGAAGAAAVNYRLVGAHDVVIGITASGTAPFAWGALCEARRRGARTVLVCFNPFLVIPREIRPDIVLAVDLGPELLTGSTRLKAGTATKLLLNMFTTLAMVRLGKVVGNLMVEVDAANEKLRQRAVRIVRELSGADEAQAVRALRQHHWDVRRAAARLSRQQRPHR